MPFAVVKSALGIGKEVTPGTAVAAADWIPVTSMAPVENIPALMDESIRGSMAKSYGAAPGPQYASYDFAGNIFADTVGYALVGVMGDDVVTGAAAPYSHAVTLYNGNNGQPPTYTLVDNNGLESISYAGTIFNEVGFKFSSTALATYTAKAVSRSFASSGTIPPPSYSTLVPVAAYQTVMTLGGSAVSTETDVELTIKRSATPIFTLNNTTGAYNIFAGGDLEVTGKMTGVFEVATLRNNFRAGTYTSVDINYSVGATTTTQALNLHSTNGYLTKANIIRGKTYVEIEVEFDSQANTTDAGASGGQSPLKATLQNAKATGTYK